MGALAPAPLPIRQAVSAVAANQGGVIAVTGEDVRILDETGFPTARFLRTGAPLLPPSHRRQVHRAGGFAAAAGVLDDGDFNDPHDPDSEVEDAENILVEDDAPTHRPSRSPPGQAGVAVAVGGAFAWLGREDGLWRIPFRGGSEKVALPAGGPVHGVAASPGGRVVAAALDDGLAWSNDGGHRFERIAGVPVRVTRMAVTDSGRVYALARGGLHRFGSGATAGDLLVPDAEDVVPCGDGALALAHHRIVVLAGPASGEPETNQTTDGATEVPQAGPLVPPGANRLACAPDGALWIAYGAALWTSADRGQSWTPRDDLSVTFAIGAVSVTRRSLWVASGAGLAVLPLRPGDGAGLGGAVASSPLASLGGDVPPRPRWRWWLAAFPSVELGFATARSNTRRDVRAFVLLSFTFDPHRSLRAERQLEAETRDAQARDQAQRWLTRDMRAELRLDPVAAEERDATLRLLDD